MMSMIGRLEDGRPSGVRRTWAVIGEVAAKVALAAIVAVLAVVTMGRSDDASSDAPPAPYETRALEAQAAVLLDEQVDEQLMLCRYKVKATFGVSVFSDTRMSAKRLVRLHNDEEIAGSCAATEGGDTIGCAGLSWEHEWIRVGSGTTLGWSPASCFEKIGMF